MSDRDGYSLTQQPLRKWRWWHIVIAVLAVLIIVSLFGGSSSPKMKVTVLRQGAGGFQRVEAVNTGDKAVTITGLVVNDRPDCRVVAFDQLTVENPTFNATRLEIGEGNTWFTPCRVVRAAFTTSLGSGTYEFK